MRPLTIGSREIRAAIISTKLVLSIAAGITLTGCGVTLSPVKRKPLQVEPLVTSLSAEPQKMIVQFDSTLPGKRLDVTVWDNVSGAFADEKEAKQIGFTQNYNKLIPAAALGGVAGGAIGGAVVSVTAGPTLVETRIVIPFGPIFQNTFQSGLTQTFPNAVVCSNDAAGTELRASGQFKHQVNVHVTEFRVWEQPLNHINLQAKITCKVQPIPGDKGGVTFEVQRQATSQPIGTMMSTSSGFIREMNKVANKFAGDLANETLMNLQTKLEP
jgi:hypothetical protein